MMCQLCLGAVSQGEHPHLYTGASDTETMWVCDSCSQLLEAELARDKRRSLKTARVAVLKRIARTW